MRQKEEKIYAPPAQPEHHSPPFREETIEFRKVPVPEGIPALCDFDRNAFQDTPGDFYSPEKWAECESYWLVVDGQVVGCTAFELNTDGRNAHPGPCRKLRGRDGCDAHGGGHKHERLRCEDVGKERDHALAFSAAKMKRT